MQKSKLLIGYPKYVLLSNDALFHKYQLVLRIEMHYSGNIDLN